MELFLNTKHLPQKAVLILDNAPCHPPVDELVKETSEGKIWVLYMPPNVTPLIQPMDQNAIKLVKLHYKNSLLYRIIGSDDDILSVLKKLNLYDAAMMITQSFASVKESSLAKCWNKIFIPNEEDFSEEDDIPLSILLQTDEEISSIRNGVLLLNQIFPEVNKIMVIL